ncbi:MAG TPA: CpsB/CapC family capsule biosynthesis tyrosine phosphatase, partial [Terracidiphilus sp.]
YHLIFGVDDGPKSLEASLALAESSIAEGVTHIVATPHASYKYPYQAEVNRERLAILQDRFAGQLTLGLGCDFHLSDENLTELEKTPKKFTVNGTRYLLVEFPDFLNARTFNEVFFRIMGLGLIPIITHPERNPSLLESPNAIIEWVHNGCLVQVTAASLTGRFGPQCETLTRLLLRGNYVHIIASDAHNTAGRAPAMRSAFDALTKDFGKDTAERLCIQNPRAVFFGEILSAQPEAKGPLYVNRASKRGFFRRWFG